ncbi:hypothetical protein V5O48_019112 [Marasmius crinis-equi]|uniref:Uncharacterized protein n=1 Tax=Marasmius crinis-equi TaxID=585013 RepID=A0ABR3EJF9_9AGAR
MGFSIDVHQKEKCRKSPSPEYKARYPLPPTAEQPPNLPLRQSQQLAYLCDNLCAPPSSTDTDESRSFSILSSISNGQYQADGPNYIFNDGKTEPSTWFTLQCSIPLSSPDAKHNSRSDLASEWAGDAIRRPSSSGLPLTVRHQISVKITLGYDSPDHKETAAKPSFRRFIEFTPSKRKIVRN